MRKNVSRSKPPPTRLAGKDIKYLEFSLNEHLALIKDKHGVLWDKNVQAETARVERIVRTVKAPKGTGETLTGEDYLFIEFSLLERCDFLEEGIGNPYQGSAHEPLKVRHLLNKIRETFGLNQSLSNSYLSY